MVVAPRYGTPAPWHLYHHSMFEHKTEPVLPRRLFLSRLAVTGLQAATILAVWLALGIAGYHWIAGFGAFDALLNASMIVSGMGPVDHIDGHAAKVFASVYALLSGMVFLSTFALVLAPLTHRLLHHFHREAPHLPSHAAHTPVPADRKNDPARP